MTDRYSIAVAERRHLDALSQVELAAAVLLTGHAPLAVLEATTPPRVLAEAMQRGHVWVALQSDAPVGFAQVEMLSPDLPHLEEIDVLPAHGRQGLGTRLVRTVCDWATASGYLQLTLTTFRAVPWNMPWYARLGFVELLPDAWPPEVRRQVDAETARGLDPARRVVMAYRCRGPAGQAFAAQRSDPAPLELLVSTQPAALDVQYLEDRLYEFNAAATGLTDGEWLAIFVRDRDQRIVAGINGSTWGGCADIRQFWVEPARRKQGLGTRLLEATEQEAVRRGCRTMVLMTFSFQAPAFYARHGFEVVAVVNDHPHGHTNLLLRKHLGGGGV